MNGNNIFDTVPKWLAIIIGGIGFVIGFTQPLWVAIVYVLVLLVLAFIWSKVRETSRQ